MKLKNGCPFCGYNTCQILGPKSQPNASTYMVGFQVECMNCGARGPCGMKTQKDAIGVWENGDLSYRRPLVEEPRLALKADK